MKRGMSILVKKPAKSWLKMRGGEVVSKLVVCRRRMRSKTSPLAKLWGQACGTKVSGFYLYLDISTSYKTYVSKKST